MINLGFKVNVMRMGTYRLTLTSFYMLVAIDLSEIQSFILEFDGSLM